MKPALLVGIGLKVQTTPKVHLGRQLARQTRGTSPFRRLQLVQTTPSGVRYDAAARWWHELLGERSIPDQQRRGPPRRLPAGVNSRAPGRRRRRGRAGHRGPSRDAKQRRALLKVTESRKAYRCVRCVSPTRTSTNQSTQCYSSSAPPRGAVRAT